MPNSVAIAAIVGGIILLILGLLDKGTLIKIFNAEISNTISNKFSKFLCIFLGIVLIIASLSLEVLSFNNKPKPIPINNYIRPHTVEQSFFATSYCSMTNVYGYGKNSNVNIAQELAIDDCVNNGGIPNCCSSNLRVSQGK
ncbi:MAG: hypothetical protein AAGE84_05855 [Cyanobacteria bacterium P01_G01_bin.39]